MSLIAGQDEVGLLGGGPNVFEGHRAHGLIILLSDGFSGAISLDRITLQSTMEAQAVGASAGEASAKWWAKFPQLRLSQQ